MWVYYLVGAATAVLSFAAGGLFVYLKLRGEMERDLREDDSADR